MDTKTIIKAKEKLKAAAEKNSKFKDEFIEFTPRKQKTALILALVLILLDFGLNIYFISVNGFDYHMITSMLPCVMMGIYAVKGYLKPHGSNVKIMFLFKCI